MATSNNQTGQASSGDEARRLHREDMIKIYVQWINHQLAKAGKKHRPVTNLHNDLRDGTTLAKLIEIVVGHKVDRLKRSPTTPTEMLDNLSCCLNCIMMKLHAQSIKDITAKMIYDGETKPTLRVLFALSEHRKLLDSKAHSGGEKPEKPSPPSYDQAVRQHPSQLPMAKPLTAAKQLRPRSSLLSGSTPGLSGSRRHAERSLSLPRSASGAADDPGRLVTFSKDCRTNTPASASVVEVSCSPCRIPLAYRARCGSDCAGALAASDPEAQAPRRTDRQPLAHTARPPNLTKLYLPRLRSTDSSPSHSRFTLNPIEEVDPSAQRGRASDCQCYLTSETVADPRRDPTPPVQVANDPQHLKLKLLPARPGYRPVASCSSYGLSRTEHPLYSPLRRVLAPPPTQSKPPCDPNPSSSCSPSPSSAANHERDCQMLRLRQELHSAQQHIADLTKRLQSNSNMASSFQDTIQVIQNRIEQLAKLRAPSPDPSAPTSPLPTAPALGSIAASSCPDMPEMPDILNLNLSLNLSDSESIVTSATSTNTLKTFSSGYMSHHDTEDTQRLSLDSSILSDSCSANAPSSSAAAFSSVTCATTDSSRSQLSESEAKKKSPGSKWLKPFRAFKNAKKRDDASPNSVRDLPPISDASSTSTLTMDTQQQPVSEHSCLPMTACSSHACTAKPIRESLPPSSSIQSCRGEVTKLKAELLDRDIKLADAQFESLTTANEISDLRAIVMRMQTELATLKQENERMQELLLQHKDNSSNS